jgi:hypothetical protein
MRGQQEAPEQELIRLEKQWAEAGTRGDFGFFDRIAADDYVIVDASGEVRNKQQELAVARNEKFDTLTADDLAVRLYRDTAVVVGRYSFSGTNGGLPFSETGRFTDVWLKRSGKWLLISSQNTTLPVTAPPEPPPDSFFIEKEKAVWDAIKSKNKSADSGLLADDFVGLYDTGFAAKSDHVSQMDDKYAIERYDLQDTKVLRLSSTMALLLYKATCKGTGAWEQYCSRPDYVSSLWVEREGHWVNLFSQDTQSSRR